MFEPRFGVCYDFRNPPDSGVPDRQLYAEALDQVAWLDGLGADIDISTWPVPPLFDFIKEVGHVEDREMFSVFNMGVGMTIIVEPGLADDVMNSIPGAFRIGEVVERAPVEERTKLIGL